MADYDAVEKEFEKYPDIFADILNALIYDGDTVVTKDELWSAETETSYQDENGKLRRQNEDLAKYVMDENGRQALYLIANQTDIDRRMLLRKYGYVGGYYRSQYNGQSEDICPVIEIILYWGKKRWKSNRTMQVLFQKKRIDKRAWKFINGERLHVFEMRHLPHEVIERFKSDMRIVLEYLQDPHYAITLDQKVEHPDALLSLLSALSGDERYVQLAEALHHKNLRKEKGGRVTMCVLIDEYWEKGRLEGIAEGRSEGRTEGKAEGLIAVCKDFNATFDATMEKLKNYLSLNDADAQKYMKLYW